ncbi:MAG TPA: pyridoxamine 5'-phosphate oxidase family protein [Bacteroidia bacterium]|nr:pyridoxamine 5'-phosphate oxidase family protein [Bacteroidia bacterium]
MSEQKNLYSEEAINKLQELAEDADIAILTSGLTNLPLSACPMSTRDVDEHGHLWFLSTANSDHNHNIARDNRVQLFYSNHSSSEYLSIYGTAEILKDRTKIDELWSSMAKTWFNEGKDDPNLTVIKVMPLEAYYWDTKTNKMVSLFKILSGAITGKENDDGIQGKIFV